MFYVTTIVLLFILRIRFPRNRPISVNIANRYGEQTLRKFRALEKTWSQHDKIEHDLQFLEACSNYEVIPKFLRIKLYKRTLQNTPLCKSFQNKLLLNEIKHKRSALHRRQSQLEEERNALKGCISSLDYACLYLWLQRKQATNNLKTRPTHDNKLQKLEISRITCTLDIDKIIFNYSSKVLTQEQKQVLSLGLDFCLPVYWLKF